MSKNDQNTCLETPDTTPNARLRYLSSYEDIPSLILALLCKIRPRASLGSDSGPVYTIPDSLVTTSSFAVTEQWLVANAY